ncbi:MAG: hypothetical protein JJ992_22910, partial [Planctomycetes bacterium]|nr:hypothetical protein [Planctomycetota bacterium]
QFSDGKLLGWRDLYASRRPFVLKRIVHRSLLIRVRLYMTVRRYPRPLWPMAICLGLVSLAAVSRGQIPDRGHRLPPIDLTPAEDMLRSADEASYLLARDPPQYITPEDVLVTQEPHLTAYKSGFFQKLSFTATEILPDGSNGLGMLETELFAAFALPAPTVETPIVLTPNLLVNFVDDPAYVQLPSQLYAAFLDIMWLPKIGQRTLAMLAVAPGWYSDFEGGTRDAFRLTGRAILRYDWHPDRLQLILGAIYLDRMNSKWIPAGGVIFTPNPDLNLEVVFPRTKLAKRTACGMGFEHWIYLTGGFGGNDWAIVQPDGSPDELGLMDWRITAGWERKTNGGAGLQLEIGYVFSREIRFASSPVELTPGDTVLLRAGLAY